MHFIELKEISKVYTQSDCSAIGLKNVSVSFNIGEFVAIVGKSGAGKSTLLKVLGGMETYEEGEMFVDGLPTSHFTEEEWSEYRKKYIAFIHQDYKIIDSLSVWENVEVALLNNELQADSRQLIEKYLESVGMLDYISHKGNQLSGGEKQRVAIARALAMGKPIILADEPTGNLDERNALEIVNLLSQVSEDRLVIMVTHNYEDVKTVASRVIKIEGGEIENDTGISGGLKSKQNREGEYSIEKLTKTEGLKRGWIFGWKFIRSKWQSTILLGCLFTLIGVFFLLASGFIGRQVQLIMSQKNSLFREVPGRIIVSWDEGDSIDASDLAEKYDAMRYEKCDILNEKSNIVEWYTFIQNPESYLEIYEKDIPFWIVSKYEVGIPDIGRYPQSNDECMIYIPYALSDYYGTEEINQNYIEQNGLMFKIVGIKYFLNCNNQGQMLITQEAFDVCSMLTYAGKNIKVKCIGNKFDIETVEQNNLHLSYSLEIPENTLYLRDDTMDTSYNDMVRIDIVYDKQIEEKQDFSEQQKVILTSESDCQLIINSEETSGKHSGTLVMNPLSFIQRFNEIIAEDYNQCSLFFDNSREEQLAFEKIRKDGYMAVFSTATYQPYGISEADNAIKILGYACLLGGIFVLAFLILNVCTIGLTKQFGREIEIIYCMGMEEYIVNTLVYVRLIVPFGVAMGVTSVMLYMLYLIPFFSKYQMYFGPGIFVVFCVIMLLLVCRIIRAIIVKSKQRGKYN